MTNTPNHQTDESAFLENFGILRKDSVFIYKGFLKLI